MRKRTTVAVAAAAALAAGGVVANISTGSSHREAPLASMDPTADDTDLYAFTANAGLAEAAVGNTARARVLLRRALRGGLTAAPLRAWQAQEALDSMQ